MTRDAVAAWLAARRPAPPAALAARLTHALAAYSEERLRAAGTMAEAMADLGLATLAGLKGGESAELALDLLAADGFVTYAFEAAAEEGVNVESLATRLLTEAGR